MKRIKAHIKQTALFLLLGVLVLSSTGFNICSHTCRYSGKADYSLVLQHKSEACCGTEAPVKKNCCDDKDTYFKLDVVKKVEDDSHHAPQKLLILLAVLLPDYLSVSQPDYSSVFSGHAPPFSSARTILSLVQVFRI